MLQYEDGLTATNSQMLKNFNGSLLALKPASDAGVHLLGAGRASRRLTRLSG